MIHKNKIDSNFESLTFQNYFSNYFFQPRAKSLNPSDHKIALAVTILLSVFSIGIIPVGVLVQRTAKRTCCAIKKDPSNSEKKTIAKTQEIVAKKLPETSSENLHPSHPSSSTVIPKDIPPTSNVESSSTSMTEPKTQIDQPTFVEKTELAANPLNNPLTETRKPPTKKLSKPSDEKSKPSTETWEEDTPSTPVPPSKITPEIPKTVINEEAIQQKGEPLGEFLVRYYRLRYIPKEYETNETVAKRLAKSPLIAD